MKKYVRTTMYKFSMPIINFLFKIIFTPKYYGLENIPSKGRIILAGTHTSICDSWYLMTSTKRTVHFLAKKEIFSGLFGWYFSNMGLIPVDRSKHDGKPLKEAIKYLNNERLICIFPEGTTEKGRGLMEFKMGAVKLATETNTQIIPFAIRGKYKLFSRNLEIHFGKPYTVKCETDLTNENKKLRNKVKDLLGEE